MTTPRKHINNPPAVSVGERVLVTSGSRSSSSDGRRGPHGLVRLKRHQPRTDLDLRCICAWDTLSSPHPLRSPMEHAPKSTPEFFATPGYGEWAREHLHYSQALRIGNRIETSGQGGWDDHWVLLNRWRRRSYVRSRTSSALWRRPARAGGTSFM